MDKTSVSIFTFCHKNGTWLNVWSWQVKNEIIDRLVEVTFFSYFCYSYSFVKVLAYKLI